jgi:hypothetical protein
VILRIVSLLAAIHFAAARHLRPTITRRTSDPRRRTAVRGQRPGPWHGAGDARQQQISLQGKFSGLSSPATQARLHMGNVMGGIGPAIGGLKIAQAQSGEISGAFTLTPGQIAALKVGKLYVMLDSQSAPKGNLWGWFQPAHVTVGPDVPQMDYWYIPNFLNDENNDPAKKRAGRAGCL